jgi:hypothetical protein
MLHHKRWAKRYEKTVAMACYTEVFAMQVANALQPFA